MCDKHIEALGWADIHFAGVGPPTPIHQIVSDDDLAHGAFDSTMIEIDGLAIPVLCNG